MNGPVYISFFQGQLESVLEQVVQLAVQEISKTVGSSLNALLLETAAKEQENHQLKLQLQSRENPTGGGSPVSGKSKAGKAAGDERADSSRTKPEQRGPGGQCTQPGFPTDTRRLEQRGRLVDQLKSVMEQVLDFALRELTKIVEASFDDLLLEITKMEREQQHLQDSLGKSSERAEEAVEEKGRRGPGGRWRGSENDSMSRSGSEDAREDHAEVPVSKAKTEADESERAPVLSASQDWVPILDKVFGQKWCSDVWQVKELAGEKEVGGDGGGRALGVGVVEQVEPLSSSVTLEASPSSLQQDPRWTPLEDMEVFSPDNEDMPDSQRNTETGISGRCSSASMLHRLLTLPSQLLEEDEEDAAAKETLATLATDGTNNSQDSIEPPRWTGSSPLTKREKEEEEEEEEEEEDRGKKKKRRRVLSECEECGRRFSRMSCLKAHRQTHNAENIITEASSPSSPSGSTGSALRCSECGKRFSSATRLHSHIQTQHHGNWS